MAQDQNEWVEAMNEEINALKDKQYLSFRLSTKRGKRNRINNDLQN
ncbi:hypothetical protein PJM45_28850 [Mycobacterium kansasii]